MGSVQEIREKADRFMQGESVDFCHGTFKLNDYVKFEILTEEPIYAKLVHGTDTVMHFRRSRFNYYNIWYLFDTLNVLDDNRHFQFEDWNMRVMSEKEVKNLFQINPSWFI